MHEFEVLSNFTNRKDCIMERGEGGEEKTNENTTKQQTVMKTM